MTEKVKERLEFLLDCGYRKNRADGGKNLTSALSGLHPAMRNAQLFKAAVDAEKPVLYKEDLFGFNRFNRLLPVDDSVNKPYIFKMSNFTADYETLLEIGIEGLRKQALSKYEAADEEAKAFYDALFVTFDACADITEKYRVEAQKNGCVRLYNALSSVPLRGARDYYEALVTVHFLQYALRLNNVNHVTIGRFDQYMYPYYLESVKNGVSREELLELTELFFISLNFDTDLYAGMQQGDNGQSMVLGGCDENGAPAFNELSEMCLTASEELKIIDPKINLRVNKSTPLKVYERGTRLTKQGLGFPQYSNDDVVIDALVDWGYDLKDARNYTVAACWEFIVPRYGADIPNIGVMNFPLVVDRAVRKHLASSADFDEFLGFVEREIKDECDFIIEDCNKRYTPYSVFTSAFILPCIEKGRDVSKLGAKYNNFGVHGAGIANAADALAAIKKEVFEKKELSADELIAALDADFEGYGDVRRKLLDSPKMGNNDDYVDNLGAFLMDKFALHLGKKPNNRGGIYRAGTGSAMEYVLSAAKVGATADGRRAHQAYGSSFSPSLDAVIQGPLSAVQSFTKADLKKVCNGGPFTIEIHDTVFRNSEGEKKTAALIKTFIDLGGHQIQINAINRDTLIDAQKHPEKYPNLIVRVWGWSGYFRELDVCYQNHIIRRTEFGF